MVTGKIDESVMALFLERQLRRHDMRLGGMPAALAAPELAAACKVTVDMGWEPPLSVAGVAGLIHLRVGLPDDGRHDD